MKIRILFLKPNQWNVKNCITQWGQRHFEVAYVYKNFIVLVNADLSLVKSYVKVIKGDALVY